MLTRRRGKQLRTFRIGATARRDDGLRIAVTRRPPRGVPKAEWSKLFDVWLPLVAPSAVLVKGALSRGLDDDKVRRKFFAAYERELTKPDVNHAIDLLAAMAARTAMAIGCFCEDESRCHRSVLKRVIEARMTSLSS